MHLVKEKVDEAKVNNKSYFIDYNRLFREFDFEYLIDHDKHDELDKIFHSVPVVSWLCTDTYVGLNAILFNDEVVCITWQSARKDEIDYYWLSKEHFNKCKDELIKFCKFGNYSLYIEDHNDSLLDSIEYYSEVKFSDPENKRLKNRTEMKLKELKKSISVIYDVPEDKVDEFVENNYNNVLAKQYSKQKEELWLLNHVILTKKNK
jgi:L-rhamnose mutarotase